jgi:hypothetical protein
LLFNKEEFVHEAKSQLIIFITELLLVAETFEKDKALVSAAFSNGALNQLHHQM